MRWWKDATVGSLVVYEPQVRSTPHVGPVRWRSLSVWQRRESPGTSWTAHGSNPVWSDEWTPTIGPAGGDSFLVLSRPISTRQDGRLLGGVALDVVSTATGERLRLLARNTDGSDVRVVRP